VEKLYLWTLELDVIASLEVEDRWPKVIKDLETSAEDEVKCGTLLVRNHHLALAVPRAVTHILALLKNSIEAGNLLRGKGQLHTLDAARPISSACAVCCRLLNLLLHRLLKLQLR
jgi:hypothetical protein